MRFTHAAESSYFEYLYVLYSLASHASILRYSPESSPGGEGKEFDIDPAFSRSCEYPPKWPELNTDAEDFFKSLQNEKKPVGD